MGAVLGFLLGGAALIQGNQGTQHPAWFWLPLAIICLALGALCLGVLGLLLFRSRKRPKLDINAGTGWEYEHSTPPDKAMIDLVRSMDPAFIATKLYVTRLRVKETAQVSAKNVSTRLAAAFPAPPDGLFSFPAYLTFHGTDAVTKKRDFAPGDRDFVGILHLVEMADGRFATSPPFLAFYDPIVLEIEVLLDGKRVAAKYFSISGHTAVGPDGKRVVTGQHPLVTEVPVLGATD